MQKVVAFSGEADSVAEQINRWQAQNRTLSIINVATSGTSEHTPGDYPSYRESFLTVITYED